MGDTMPNTPILVPDNWEHRHIRAVLAEFEAGKFISNERVVEWLESWGTENELPPPKVDQELKQRNGKCTKC